MQDTGRLDGALVHRHACPQKFVARLQKLDAEMPDPNQIQRLREDVTVEAKDLLQVPEGARTEDGLRHNVRVGIQYLEAWLGAQGCVPLYGLMEDAATAEISRTQVWQWIRHRAVLDDGSRITAERVIAVIDREMEKIHETVGEPRFTAGHFAEARDLFQQLVTATELTEFLTLPAYERLIENFKDEQP